MKTFSYVLAILGLAIVAAFAGLNWTTLMSPAPLDLLIMKINAPLGVVMLAIIAILFVLFALAYMGNQVSSMIEVRGLRKEVQRAQQLADQAEESRFEGLRQMISKEFEQLGKRLHKGTLLVEPVTSASGIRQPSLVDLVTGRNPT